jgi:twitching motility protein PilT
MCEQKSADDSERYWLCHFLVIRHSSLAMAYIDQFLQIVVRQDSSDLHIAEGQPPKIRTHGDIMAIRDEPVSHDEATRMLSEVCGEHNWEIFQKHGDLDFAYQMDEQSRFRTNYFKQSYGYGAAFRLIPTKISSVEELGVPVIIKDYAYLRGGLVLVTGPTGSGKTTTQAALIDFINQNFSKHVVTIEEPIEFVHENKRSIITQREVPTDSISFPAGLKAILREDTDIVLIGEMRDLETISLALTAAETGLLVIGTLHTNNARKTVDRMIDAFPADRQAQARAMLANSLRGVVAQLLLKRADRPGRIAVNEILIANAAVAAIIREGATHKLQDVIVSGRAQGMQFMDDAIWALLQKGIVSSYEAFMKAIDKSRFKPFLSPEEAALANAAGSVREDEKGMPGNFVKGAGPRTRVGTR